MHPTGPPDPPERRDVDRRQFIAAASSCAAHVALLAAFAPSRAAALFGRPAGRIVAQEPWGRLEEIADGVWALISTPLQDRTTLCNGGIIRGSAGVLVVESFAGTQGAAWLAGQARSLTGRWPDQVVLTHYHGDHSGGIAGFIEVGASPALFATTTTRDLITRQDAGRSTPPPAERTRALAAARPIDMAARSTIDLGDRRVTLVPHAGHTASDVTIEIDDPAVVFCGDLVWNAMFPNYVDAVPSRLTASVRALRRERPASYVPGHGPMADADDVSRYTGLLESVEAAARDAHANGLDAAAAAERYRVPASLGDWALFSPRYHEIAIGAWLRELAGEDAVPTISAG